MKEANVYNNAGYKVTVYGLWYTEEILNNDLSLLDSGIVYKAGIDLRAWSSFRSVYIRLKRRISRQMVKMWGINSIGALGYDYKNYLLKLKSERSDLYIGHEEMSMALSKDLIETGHHVIFDFEDWHSKDLMPKDRRYRPLKLLEHLEAFLLKKACYCYTTSHAMSKALASYYEVSRPRVIYNSFRTSERQHMDSRFVDRTDKDLPSLFWFSQVISAGRGLELLFKALSLCNQPCQLHLRGSITDVYREHLEQKCPQHVNLYIHDLVHKSELISRIKEHDIGIAFEDDTPENKDLTISNKIFHYLQSGIAILATRTKGQAEIHERCPQAVALVDRDARKISKKLESILEQAQTIQLMKEASLSGGEHPFSYELMEVKLKEWAHNFFESKNRTS